MQVLPNKVHPQKKNFFPMKLYMFFFLNYMLTYMKCPFLLSEYCLSKLKAVISQLLFHCLLDMAQQIMDF